jgi:hypothetical protein
VLYLSGMYTRGEMALRLGLFYTAASLSGAFGGQSELGVPMNVQTESYQVCLQEA